MNMKPDIRHIGNVISLCKTPHAKSNLREDLPFSQYRDMPLHKHLNDFPFRMCKKCLSIIKKRRG